MRSMPNGKVECYRCIFRADCNKTEMPLCPILYNELKTMSSMINKGNPPNLGRTQITFLEQQPKKRQ